MRHALLLLLIFQTSTYAQNQSASFKEKELKTTITDVTVFLSSAQVFESGTVSLPAGKTLLRVRNISPFIDGKSVQVKGDGDFTILSVNHRFNYLNTLQNDYRIDSLRNVIAAIDLKLASDHDRLTVISAKQTLLDANKMMGTESSGVSIAQLREALQLYETEITKIKTEQTQLNRNIATKNLERSQLEQQLKVLSEQRILPSSEVEIRVSSEEAITVKFILSYLVANAGWFPKYDLRVRDISKPLSLIYKAEVFQNTGVEWKNVKLKFSNANPNQSGVAPELSAWKLNYARNTIFENPYAVAANAVDGVKGRVFDSYGNPLPGVNVVVKGTTIGTVTDASGGYSLTLPNAHATLVFTFIGYVAKEVPVTRADMNINLEEDVKQLSEVVVTSYGVQGRASGVNIRGAHSARKVALNYSNPIVTTVIENQTTVEIAVDIPYTIKSDGEKIMVDLRNLSVPAAYEYYAVPKLDKDAFLVARVVNWDQYHLLEGEANLYFEDSFVGRSILNTKVLTDTLTISLGRDKNIVIGRTKVEQFTKRKTLASNTVDTRGFKISVRNKKSQPIHLFLYDQLPVAVTSDIFIDAVELSGANHDIQSGKLSWDLTIDAQQQKELTFQYEVKYPRREKVVLE